MRNIMKNTMIMMSFVAALAIFIAPANAAVTDNFSSPFSLSIFVPCLGEIVDVNGDLHTLISSTINGNKVSGVMHFQPQGVSGTGETTGLKYQGTGVTSTSFTMSLQNGQANMTFVNNFRIIGQGPNNNFVLHETAHITFNADGTVTVNFDNISADCK